MIKVKIQSQENITELPIETTYIQEKLIATPQQGTRVLLLLLRSYLMAAVPIILVLFSARLVMTPLFLNLEYGRPGFPEDEYGFTQEDRLNYAPYALNYLLNNADIGYLGDLTFADGTPLYEEGELQHMEDVKVVTQAAFTLLAVVGLGAVIVSFFMWRNPTSRNHFRMGLRYGAVLTLSMIVGISVAAITAWDFFFTTFHTLFFESGTWRFLYSDTLIRLFPEQFWFDASLTIGGLTVAGAVVILVATWRQWGKAAT